MATTIWNRWSEPTRWSPLQNASRWLLSPKRALSICLLVTVLLLSLLWFRLDTPASRSWTAQNDATPVINGDQRPPLHVLMLATNPDENLCKTLISGSILGYSSPVILGWGEQVHEDMPHGGTHILKIIKSYEYLSTLDESHDDDVVLIIDAFDMQFQLPPEVLLERFERVSAKSNQRLETELGAAFRAEHIRNTIFFGSQKRRYPSPIDDVSVWTVPDSPAPKDVYGKDTDTPIGRNEQFSRRQRFLNAGFLIGRLGPVRKMYHRASQRLDVVTEAGDSDQRLMGLMRGEQNYWRELMRLKHDSWWRRVLGTSKPRHNRIEGLYVDNILNPSFTHVKFKPDADTNYEFGISVDHLTDFSHQTAASHVGIDSDWITYADVDDEVRALKRERNRHDCKIRAPKKLPHDIANLPGPYAVLEREGKFDEDDVSQHLQSLTRKNWLDVPLYTHLCYGAIPVLIHHNARKYMRNATWPNMWYQADAKEMLVAQVDNSARQQAAPEDLWEAFRKEPFMVKPGGAWTQNGKWLDWTSVCPASEYGSELFRSNKPQDWI